ncbi:MAG: nucleoside hydrolase [Clostridia bacterium]|nr:nucleoside hydrolase [Clostridia bacterium]
MKYSVKDPVKRPFLFTVPEKKKFRVIVHTDCKNEADDQFALAHHLMTPKFNIRAVIAGHFDFLSERRYGAKGLTTRASYDEIIRVMRLMDMEDTCPVYMGATMGMADEQTPVFSEGADCIIREAMSEDERPLFVVFQGAITDLACAYLKEPRIEERLTAIWIGGGIWPDGGDEFNLMQDIHAANIVFASDIALWQVPKDVYKQMGVTLAELQVRCAPYGAIGKYLFEQMVEFNNMLADFVGDWPHGESWGLGDQATVSLLLEEQQRCNYVMRDAPRVNPVDMAYIHDTGYRQIRVYHTLDTRQTMEDFYAKLQLCFPCK